MFLLRLRPLFLFLLLMLPVAASALLKSLATAGTANALRQQVIAVNLSSLFAILFVAWIITLVFALAPGAGSRWTIAAGMALGMAFRTWQDSWTIDELYASGHELSVEDLDPLSPYFILHAAVSLFMLATLALLARWLVRKEKSAGIAGQPFWLTFVQLLVFPVGLFWIQKRARQFLPEKQPEA